jgi:hypothetical protein
VGSFLQRSVVPLNWKQKRAGFVLLGAVVLLAFALGIDLQSIDYITFMLGAVTVLAGLVMLYRCEVKRTKLLK